MVRYSVHSALFGFFCVLDGVRAIEAPGQKGTLQLTYDRGHIHTVLNSEDNFLHDIYQYLVYDEVFGKGELS